MSLSLGEKLRQAREERGFTLSEVAEQTRISGLYLESIENDDYSRLPGGIFNKGFVKSYAKFVGLNEQEALTDYAALTSFGETDGDNGPKVYRPEVLTDDRSASSMVPTAIAALVILAIMSAGVYFLVSYLRPSEPTTSNSNTTTNANTEAAANLSTEPSSNLPEMGSIKVEFTAVSQPVRLVAIADGTKTDSNVSAGTSTTFEPKDSLTLNYNRWNAEAVQLTINGKAISLPAEPLAGTTERGRIEFTINRENLGRIWTTGAITAEVPNVSAEQPATDGQATPEPSPGGATPAVAEPTQPRSTATPVATNRPAANANATQRATPEPRTTRTPAPARTPPAATPTPGEIGTSRSQ
ncbi:MAG: helix-turn-helix domain-containing protein [Pyrinomonadaceae bacterium]